MSRARDVLLESLFNAARSFYFHHSTGEFWDKSETKESVREHLFLSLMAAAEYLRIIPPNDPRLDYHEPTGIVTISFVAGKWISDGIVNFALLGKEIQNDEI